MRSNENQKPLYSYTSTDDVSQNDKKFERLWSTHKRGNHVHIWQSWHMYVMPGFYFKTVDSPIPMLQIL